MLMSVIDIVPIVKHQVSSCLSLSVCLSGFQCFLHFPRSFSAHRSSFPVTMLRKGTEDIR